MNRKSAKRRWLAATVCLLLGTGIAGREVAFGATNPPLAEAAEDCLRNRITVAARLERELKSRPTFFRTRGYLLVLLCEIESQSAHGTPEGQRAFEAFFTPERLMETHSRAAMLAQSPEDLKLLGEIEERFQAALHAVTPTN